MEKRAPVPVPGKAQAFQSHLSPPVDGWSRGQLWDTVSSHLSPFPTLGDRGLNAKNSEGTPVSGQTAPDAQAADGPGSRRAVSRPGSGCPGLGRWHRGVSPGSSLMDMSCHAV